MVPVPGRKIKFVHTRLEHIFYNSVGTVVSRKHSLTRCLDAAFVIESGEMNNTLSLFISDFRIAVLKDKFCDIGHGIWAYRLGFLLEVRKTPLTMYLVGT